MRVSVVARRHPGQATSEVIDGVEVHRVGSPFNLNAIGVVRKLSAKERRVVMHTHSSSGPALALMRLKQGMPVVAQVHGTSRSRFMPTSFTYEGMKQSFSSSRLWYYYFRERFLWSRADRVIAVSQSVKRDLFSHYRIPGSRVNVVYNGVDTQVFHRVDGLPIDSPLRGLEGRRVVLFVGHFGPRKGIAYLIRAMEKVKREVRDVALVCIGGIPSWLPRADYWARLNELVESSSLQDSVLLLDKVPNEQLPAYYSRASAFVLPSYYEAFAKVVVEAMACGTPTIISQEGGPAEAIRDGENGLLFPFGSTEQLARCITLVLQDDRLARKLGRNAVLTVERNLTWRKVAERVELAYHQAFEELPPGVHGESLDLDFSDPTDIRFGVGASSLHLRGEAG